MRRFRIALGDRYDAAQARLGSQQIVASGIENALFYLDNTRMLYGDAQKAAGELIQAVKAVS